MKKTLKATQINPLIIGFFIFSIIQGVCLILTGDDVMWYFHTLDNIFGNSTGNGRYFTNLITLFMEKNVPFRIAVYSFFLTLLPVLTAKIISKKKNTLFYYFLAILSFFLMPLSIANETTIWISGFTNYIISADLCLAYILWCKQLLYGKELTKKKITALPMLILGFLSCLCLETITIYVILFDIFIIAYSALQIKKVHISCIFHFIGSIAGTITMFMNSNYHQIMENNDTSGARYIQVNFYDIYTKIYTKIINDAAKPFFIFQAVICICIIYKLLKNSETLSSQKNNLLFTLSIAVILTFTCYTLFTYVFSNFSTLSPSYKTQSIELCLTFLYFISLMYASFKLFDKFSAIRSVLFIFSIIIVIVPFFVVEPVNKRCFFTDYIFWCLLAGNFLSDTFSEFKMNKITKLIMYVPLSALACFYCFMDISNKYIDNFRMDYVRKQLSENSRIIEIIHLPYPNYSSDMFYALIANSEEKETKVNLVENSIDANGYVLPYLLYNNIPNEFEGKKAIDISMYDYYISHNNQ